MAMQTTQAMKTSRNKAPHTDPTMTTVLVCGRDSDTKHIYNKNLNDFVSARTANKLSRSGAIPWKNIPINVGEMGSLTDFMTSNEWR